MPSASELNVPEKLDLLMATKKAIREAISSKGVDMPEQTEFFDYASLISNISTGVGDSELLLATATEDTVLNGKTFYAGNSRNLRIGTALQTAISAKPDNVLFGKTYYDSSGTLKTGILKLEGKYAWEKYFVDPQSNEINENTLLLLHGEDFFDSSLYKVPITNNDVAISKEQSKFGRQSLYFNGNAILKIPQTAIPLKQNNFTIDWWEYCCQSSCGTRISTAFTPGQSYGGLLIGYQGGTVYASTEINNGWNLISSVSMLSVTVNQWVHWALVRNGSKFLSFKNGQKFAETNLNGSIAYNELYDIAIGGYREQDPSYFYGYIDELRISNIARWTTNFTPPTEPYKDGKTLIGYVVSDDPNEYPDNEELGGYLYKKMI